MPVARALMYITQIIWLAQVYIPTTVKLFRQSTTTTYQNIYKQLEIEVIIRQLIIKSLSINQ